MNGVIKWFYKINYCLFLVHFKYDEAARHVKAAPFHTIVSALIYYYLKLVCGLVFCVTLSYIIYMYVANPALFTYASYHAQEQIFIYLEAFRDHVCALFLSSAYLDNDDGIVSAINEFLTILDKLNLTTVSHLPDFRWKFRFKVLMTIYRFFGRCINACHGIPDGAIIGIYLIEAHFWSYLYSHLVLLSYYRTMNEYLDKAVAGEKSSKLCNNIKLFVEISLRLHRLKYWLNGFYTHLLMITYMGAIMDIRAMYHILKACVYNGQNTTRRTFWNTFCMFLVESPSCLTATLDIYLITFITDLLISASKKLRENILVLLSTRRVRYKCGILRNVDLLMLQHRINNLNVWAYTYKTFRIDQRFTFRFFVHDVVLNVIVFLMYYANKAIYKH